MTKLAQTLLISTAALVAAVAWAAEDKKDSKHTAEPQPPTTGVAVLMPTKGNHVEGTIIFSTHQDGTHVTGHVSGLTPGKHGFHVHEFGDLRSHDGESAGAHFNPTGAKHGGPEHGDHHAGDLGNITADEQGNAKVDMHAEGLQLHFAVGRSIVVHAKADDLKTQPSGDSGPRVAVGVIGIANPKESTSGTEPKISEKRTKESGN
jgi:Cu-Zn family superoxide dismutase